MKLIAERLLVFSFVATLFLFSLLFFILPHERFSELENKYLQGAPQFTWDNIFSKTYAKETESLITDHFPFRSKWLWVKSATEQLRLQQENNGIYRGKEGYLFEKFLEPDYTKVQLYIDSLNQFAKRHSNVEMTFMLAPTSIGIYPERLPLYAPTYPQRKVNQYVKENVWSGLTYIDGFDFLNPNADEPIYYRTDHHWTTYGAYLAYAAYTEKKGWRFLEKNDFQIQTVSDSFLGSYHTRSQYHGLSPDTVEAYMPKNSVSVSVNIVDTGQTMNSVYDPAFLARKDQYSYFLGGVHAIMQLTSNLDTQQVEGDKLLVIKDSYAQSVIPFLIHHVPEIHVIDIRYFNGDLDNYIAEKEIHDVLFLYNTATFVNDSSLLKLN